MSTPLTASQILDREYLETRCKILELAAAFDRLERAEGSVDGDPRLQLVHEALQVLLRPTENRAEQVQIIFSRPYESTWREQFGMASGRSGK